MEKFNIVYIHTHDTGKLINAYGYDVISNNIDEFFCESLSFQNAFSTAPTCSPSRASLLTGQYPHQVGMLGLAQRGFKIDNTKHLANFLRLNGYHTVLSGVQHENNYYTDHSSYKFLGYVEDITSDNTNYSEEDLVYWDKNNSKLISDWIKRYDGEKPFFISFGLHGTHRKFPKNIDEEININFSIPPNGMFNNKENREDFARFKTSLKISDDSIGRVLKALKDNSYYENTIIFVTTDHGLPLPFSKCTLRDTGIGVMLAMHIPGNKNIGKTYEGLISQIDIFPTLCDLINLEKPTFLEGKSFVNLFYQDLEKNNIRTEVYSEINFHTSYEPVRSVRNQRFKYIKFFDDKYKKYNLSNIDDSPEKNFLIENGLQSKNKEMECFYDLYFDPYEKNNLIFDLRYEKEIIKLKKLLIENMKKTNDPLLSGNIKIEKKWKVNKNESIHASSKNKEDYISTGEE
ncbi:sulfatase [Helcococcus ovis]|uniref:sulfatase family protein n=1 Tax=Helcococcus ovis TaxID=72026 RepID=UPI0038BB94B8